MSLSIYPDVSYMTVVLDRGLLSKTEDEPSERANIMINIREAHKKDIITLQDGDEMFLFGFV